MTGQHRDADGDGVADRGRVIAPGLYDRQSALFREAEPDLRVSDDELAGYAEAVHAPLGAGGDPFALPEQYEADGWDRGALGAKDLGEARLALQARIEDPFCPDGPEAAGAYDSVADANENSRGPE